MNDSSAPAIRHHPRDGASRVVRRATRHPWRCILCGRATSRWVLFVPDDPIRAGLGRPPSRTVCLAIYALCTAHRLDRRTLRRAEDRLRRNQGSRWPEVV